jgi:hypothetical protein
MCRSKAALAQKVLEKQRTAPIRIEGSCPKTESPPLRYHVTDDGGIQFHKLKSAVHLLAGTIQDIVVLLPPIYRVVCRPTVLAFLLCKVVPLAN